MKTLDCFGDWLLNTGAGIAFLLIVVVLTVLVVFHVAVGDTVVLSSNEFECAMTLPDGIGSKCVEYHLKRGK